MKEEIITPEPENEDYEENLEGQVANYREALWEINEISGEARRRLDLFELRPDCALLILEAYLNKIEDLSNV